MTQVTVRPIQKASACTGAPAGNKRIRRNNSTPTSAQAQLGATNAHCAQGAIGQQHRQCRIAKEREERQQQNEQRRERCANVGKDQQC